MEYMSLPSTPKKQIKRQSNTLENIDHNNTSSINTNLFISSSINDNNNNNNSSYSTPTKYKLVGTPERLYTKEQNENIKRRNNTPSTDRYIPNRSSIDFDFCNHLLNKSCEIIEEETKKSCSLKNYENNVLAVLTPSNKRLFNFNEQSNHMDSPDKLSITLNNKNDKLISSESKKPSIRHLPTTVSRILDAPNIMDDYYLNLLHWGKLNKIAIALKEFVYLWNSYDSHIEQISTLDVGDQYVSSVRWSDYDPNILAIGTSDSRVQLWDVNKSVIIREMSGHSGRVGSLSWNGHIISSGSRDSTIINNDHRQSRSIVSRYTAHLQEVCGLAWSPDSHTLASGGNENHLCLWDSYMTTRQSSALSESSYSPRETLKEHKAAVKALAWCPWQRNTLASGGGTADRTIRIWNTSTCKNIKTVDTGSQVCSIIWNENYKELLSSHGFSDNQLILWNYPNMTRIREFRSHTARVLHLAQSPDGKSVCSASADETTSFLEIFSGPITHQQKDLIANRPIRTLRRC